jgi:aminopeptidase N
MKLPRAVRPRCTRWALTGFLALFTAAFSFITARADEPYARSRDYDLQHARISLRFDLDARQVIGDVTHSLSVLRDGITRLAFDSGGLKIASVSVNGKPAKFETTDAQLLVGLDRPARPGDKFDVSIQYTGNPKKGLYFVFPDKDYPLLPKQIWTQGESEDTRYYLPIYDYPNDRLTSEMIVTVPKDWITVSNGKLLSITDAPNGEKTWHWSESLPSSPYLITLVAGEFDELRDSWRGIPVTYYAPRGRGDRLGPTYSRTPQMIEYFSNLLGVNYPWEQYAQIMVDDFVAGGMENTSATTNTSNSLVSPSLVPEFLTGEDDLISHELAHQWFGDLVTCKDWGHVWLNEGFATYMEFAWTERQYGRDQADYERWQRAQRWFAEEQLFTLPIVRHNFTDSDEFDGNAYGKGGWVLSMLRQKLGDEAFYAGLKHYLEKNRGQTVVTADLAKAVEEATATNIDAFLNQWVYDAGAPRFDVQYSYDDASHAVKLVVKQTQKVADRVGLFTVPVEVEITTASGRKVLPILVSKQDETFVLPVDGSPLLVLFDKGDRVLKSVEFHKDKKEWLYQLKNAASVPDRADAAEALAKFKDDEAVVAGLGESTKKDSFWGVRAEAARALGRIGTPAAAKQVLAALSNREPWLRTVVVNQLGNFKDDSAVAEKLVSIFHNDASFRVRSEALQSLGRLKSPNAFSILQAAAVAESPDQIVERAALKALGALGDDRAVPLVLDSSAPGKPIELRRAALSSLGHLDKGNKNVTRRLIDYLNEPRFEIRLAAVLTLGERGDKDAIPALESLLHSGDLSIAFAPMIEAQVEHLKQPPSAEKSGPAGDAKSLAMHLEAMERSLHEIAEHLKEIESRLPPEIK